MGLVFFGHVLRLLTFWEGANFPGADMVAARSALILMVDATSILLIMLAGKLEKLHSMDVPLMPNTSKTWSTDVAPVLVGRRGRCG